MSQHRAPFVRATRVLQHVAAGLATFLAVGVVGVVGARVSAPDPATGLGPSPTRAFPDVPPPLVQAPVVVPPPLSSPPVPALVESEPTIAPRVVVTAPAPPPVVVIVQDPTPAPAAPAYAPELVLVAPQDPVEPPKPAKTPQHRQRWDTRAQTPRQDHETTQPGQLCAVVCVDLSGDNSRPDNQHRTQRDDETQSPN